MTHQQELLRERAATCAILRGLACRSAQATTRRKKITKAATMWDDLNDDSVVNMTMDDLKPVDDDISPDKPRALLQPFQDQTGTSLNIRVRNKKAPRKPPLPGTAKHIFKKIGSLYANNEDETKARSRVSLLDPEERRRLELQQFATRVISEHERSQRSTSAASERARNASQKLVRTIRSSHAVQQVYKDTVSSLENHCRSRLLTMMSDKKKQNDAVKQERANGGKPLDYFKLPSMLRRQKPKLDQLSQSETKPSQQQMKAVSRQDPATRLSLGRQLGFSSVKRLSSSGIKDNSYLTTQTTASQSFQIRKATSSLNKSVSSTAANWRIKSKNSGDNFGISVQALD